MIDSAFVFKKTLPSDTPLTVGELINLHNKYSDKFLSIWDNMRKNERYWLGENWSEEEKRIALAEDNFQLESLPAVQSKLRHIIGAFKQIRTSYKVEAESDPNDEIKSHLATLRLRNIETRSKAKYLDSEIFENGLVLGYGIRKINYVIKNGINVITLSSVPYYDFVFDLSSTTRNINERARWMAEIERLTEEEIKIRYPKIPQSYFSRISTLFNYPVSSEYYYTDEHGTPLYSLFHHYQKTSVKYYYCVFPDTQDIFSVDVITEKYSTREEAVERLEYYRKIYRDFGLNLTEENEGYVEEAIEPAIDYYVFTFAGILEYGRLKVDDFPYNIFFTIRTGNNFVSFLDYLKGIQRVFDRMWSEILYSLKTSVRNVYQANYQLLDKSETPQSVAKKLATDGGIIWTNGVDEVVKPIRKAVMDAAWGQVAQAMLSYMEDFAGGRTFFGLSQGEESGRAIYNKVAQGQLLASTFFDAFAEFKRSQGENLLKWLQYVDTEIAIMKIHGAAITEQMRELLKAKGLYEETDSINKSGYVYMNVPEVKESYLADADLELHVSEEGLSESDRERRWYQLIEAERTDVTGTLVMLPAWLELKLEVMDIDPQLKYRLIEELKAQRQAAQQQQQQLADIQKAKVLANMRNQDINLLMQQQNQNPQP